MYATTGWSFVSSKVEMDISDEDLDRLPNRQEILGLLGPPTELVDQDTGFTFEYRLKGEDPKPQIARFTVWFDEFGEKPVRFESRYSRYQTRADFIEKKMSMKVEL